MRQYFAHGNLQWWCTQPGPPFNSSSLRYFSDIANQQLLNQLFKEFLVFAWQPPHSTTLSATWIEGQREVYPLYVGSSASRPAPLQRQREVLVWVSMTQNINPIFPAQVSKVQSGLEGSPQAVHKVHHVFCRGPLHKVHRELWTTCWATISLSLHWTKKILLNNPIGNVIPGLRCSLPMIFSLVGIEASLPGRT